MIAFLPASALGATARDTVTFYGELTNQATDIPVTGNVDIGVRLFDTPSSGAALFNECWEDVAIQEGRVTLYIGAVSPFTSAVPA